MIVNLSISGHLTLGDPESQLKLASIELIALYFRVGGSHFTTVSKIADIIIGLDSACVSEGRVVFCVEKLGGRSARFLYNRSDNGGFISEHSQPNRVLTPTAFLTTILGD